MRTQGIVALAITAFAVVACGGGGGGSTGSGPTLPAGGATPTPASTPTSAAPAGTVRTSVVVNMPKGTYAAANVRHTATIGTGTVSITFTLLQENGVATSGTAQSFGLTASSPDCVTNATTGALACTLPLVTPLDTTITTATTDVFLAQTYDMNNNLTGSGAVAFSVRQNAVNTASISLSAQVANVFVYTSSYYLGTPSQQCQSCVGAKVRAPEQHRSAQSATPPPLSSVQVFVVSTDSAGNTIINPSAYNAPIYLQLAFDQGYLPDVSLNVTYAPNESSPCVGTASTATFWGSIPLCSPSDQVTATLITATGSGTPSGDAYIFGDVTAATLTPTPAPSQAPAPLPSTFPDNNSYAYIYVYPLTATLPVTGQ